MQRIAIFIHKILNIDSAPVILKEKIKFNNMTHNYNLRNNNQLQIPHLGNHNNFGKNTFIYFYTKFINEIIINDIDINHVLFKFRIKNNININFLKFIVLFKKFDLNYKIFFY